MIVPTLLIALEYDAPAECPRQERFWNSVLAAGPDLRLTVAEDAARRYHVVVKVASNGFSGELRESDRPAPRVLEAADCGELIEALALMLVLSTEQGASEGLGSAPPANRAAPPPAAEPRATARFAHEHDGGDTARPVQREPDGAVSLDALVWLGAAPGNLLGLATGVERGFGPVIVGRIEARLAFGSGRAEATFYGLAPQLCARHGWRTIELSACTGAAIGMLQMKGVEYSGPQSSGWLAPLLGFRAAALLGEIVRLELGAEGQHGFIERDYEVKSDDSRFTTPPFSAVLTLGVGARY
jgi:hypothetical protein